MIILIFLSTGCLREALWTASPSVKLIFFLGFEAIPIRQGVVLSGHAASTTRLSRDSYNSRAQVEEVLFPTITTTEPLEEPTLNGRALFTRKCSIHENVPFATLLDALSVRFTLYLELPVSPTVVPIFTTSARVPASASASTPHGIQCPGPARRGVLRTLSACQHATRSASVKYGR